MVLSAFSATEERLALALEAAELGTWTWQMASGITTWDARLEALHGLDPGGFGGTFEDWVAALHPADRAACLARVEQALAEPGPYVLLHRTTWADGSIHWIECRGKVQTDAAGNPTGTIGVAIDVTAREERDAAISQERVAEHHLVDTFQRALMPTRLPSVPGVTVEARYVAAAGETTIGGDWYAVVPVDGDRLGLAIGDVAGHGLSAIAGMADARFGLRALASLGSEPVVVIERLNQVVQTFERDTMITALYGIIDPKEQTWSFASAGHYPAVLRASDGSVSLLEHPADLPLGFGTTYRSHEHALTRGATLVLYTDGLIERRTEDIHDGFRRLLAAVRDGPAEPRALCDHLLERLLGDVPNEDDIAVVVATLT